MLHPKSTVKAASLYKEAAEDSSPEAHDGIPAAMLQAAIFHEADGMEVKALALLIRATKRGYEKALDRLNELAVR